MTKKEKANEEKKVLRGCTVSQMPRGQKHMRSLEDCDQTDSS